MRCRHNARWTPRGGRRTARRSRIGSATRPSSEIDAALPGAGGVAGAVLGPEGAAAPASRARDATKPADGLDGGPLDAGQLVPAAHGPRRTQPAPPRWRSAARACRRQHPGAARDQRLLRPRATPPPLSPPLCPTSSPPSVPRLPPYPLRSRLLSVAPRRHRSRPPTRRVPQLGTSPRTQQSYTRITEISLHRKLMCLDAWSAPKIQRRGAAQAPKSFSAASLTPSNKPLAGVSPKSLVAGSWSPYMAFSGFLKVIGTSTQPSSSRRQ